MWRSLASLSGMGNYVESMKGGQILAFLRLPPTLQRC